MDYQERQSLRSRNVSTTISLPLTLWELIDRFADSRDMTSHRALAHLIRQGLRRESEVAGHAETVQG